MIERIESIFEREINGASLATRYCFHTSSSYDFVELLVGGLSLCSVRYIGNNTYRVAILSPNVQDPEPRPRPQNVEVNAEEVIERLENLLQTAFRRLEKNHESWSESGFI